MTRKESYLLGYGDGRRYARDFQARHGRPPELDEFHRRIDRHIVHRGLEEQVGRFSYRHGYDDGCTDAEEATAEGAADEDSAAEYRVGDVRPVDRPRSAQAANHA